METAEPEQGRWAARCAESESFPRPRHYALAALFFAGIAVYGSLVPFTFAAASWADTAAQIQVWIETPLAIPSRSDFVANVLLAMPTA